MKTWTVLLVSVLGLLAAGAQPIKLAWNPSTTPNVAGYRLYAGTNSLAASTAGAAVRIDAGTNVEASVDGISPGLWYFVATAYTLSGTNKVESPPSAQLAVSVPTPPPQMFNVAVQWQGTLGTTNWQDVGFFRVRVGP